MLTYPDGRFTVYQKQDDPEERNFRLGGDMRVEIRATSHHCDGAPKLLGQLVDVKDRVFASVSPFFGTRASLYPGYVSRFVGFAITEVVVDQPACPVLELSKNRHIILCFLMTSIAGLGSAI